MKNGYLRFFLQNNLVTKIGLFYFVFAVMSFLAVSVTFPLKDTFLDTLYRKPTSQASGTNRGVPTIYVNPTPVSINGVNQLLTVLVPNSVTYAGEITLKGTKPNNSSVRINGQLYAGEETGEWQAILPLSIDNNTWEVELIDELDSKLDSAHVNVIRHLQCDIDGDQEVNSKDLSLMDQVFQPVQTTDGRDTLVQLSDCNMDGQVDLFDLGLLVKLSRGR